MLNTASQIIIKVWNNKSKFAWFVSSKAHQCAWTFKVTVRKHTFLNRTLVGTDVSSLLHLQTTIMYWRLNIHHEKEINCHFREKVKGITAHEKESIYNWQFLRESKCWNPTGKIYVVYFCLSFITPPLSFRRGSWSERGDISLLANNPVVEVWSIAQLRFPSYITEWKCSSCLKL